MDTVTTIISLCSMLGVGGILLFLVQRYFKRRDAREEKKNADLETILAKISGLEGDFAAMKQSYEDMDKRMEVVDVCLDTIKLLSYSRLSDEIDRLLAKEFATPAERHYLQRMYENYKKHGWNGDMDARLDRVWDLPESLEEFKG